MTAAYSFRVNGRVQGVGFRQATQARATALGLHGWVRNCDDGSVEGLATGGDATLQMLHDWLRQGPASARVEQLHWQPVIDEAIDDEDFQVRP